MIRLFSSSLQKLDTSFINDRLKGAVSHDHIAGYFRSSMLEVAGEKIEEMDGNVRVVCNSDDFPSMIVFEESSKLTILDNELFELIVQYTE